MRTAQVQVEKAVGPARKRIHEGIIAFNAPIVGQPTTKTFAVTLRENDAIMGGLVASVRRQWLYIDELWLDESYRGKGFGSRVMDMAEQRGRELGAKAVYVDTFSFQARPFYEKRGYHIFGDLPDYPPGHTRYWLTKTL
jgi:GNAT superfamily N-acetyltransferase